MSNSISERAMTPDGQQAIRDDARAIMETLGYTVQSVAKEASIGYTTCAAFLNGTYVGRNDNVAAALERWIASAQQKRRTRAMTRSAPTFQRTSTAEQIWGVLEHAQYMPDQVVITGAPGLGKTTTIDAFMAQTPSVWRITGEPSHKRPGAILEDIALALTIAPESSPRRMSRAIVQRLRGSGGLLIVDEAQLLSTEILEQLRSLHDLARVGLALVGNEGIYAKLGSASGKRDTAQLYSRTGMRYRRHALPRADVDMLLDAWGITDTMERKLLQAIAGRPGAARNVTKTLTVAHMLASGADKPLDRECIEMAWARLSDDAASAVAA